MKINGSVTTVERVDVDISPSTMIEALMKQWQREVGQAGHYINSKGQWEDWIDTGHGSGLTKIFREADEDEQAIFKAFQTIGRIQFSIK